MPHIIVKLYAGRSEAAKQDLTAKIVKNVADTTGCPATDISVAFEEFEPEDWAEAVYKKDILNGPGKLYKAPGYDPFSQKTETKEQAPPSLMAYVRAAAEQAAREDSSGIFNPMSWLDIELEDNPGSFDPFFDTPWDELSDHEKQERTAAVRRVL